MHLPTDPGDLQRLADSDKTEYGRVIYEAVKREYEIALREFTEKSVISDAEPMKDFRYRMARVRALEEVLKLAENAQKVLVHNK